MFLDHVPDRYSNSGSSVNPVPMSLASRTYGPHTPLITPTTKSVREGIRYNAKIRVTCRSNTHQTATRCGGKLQYAQGFGRKECGSQYGGLKASTNHSDVYLPKLHRCVQHHRERLIEMSRIGRSGPSETRSESSLVNHSFDFFDFLTAD